LDVIKEEVEEKIDIENNFLPSLSSGIVEDETDRYHWKYNGNINMVLAGRLYRTRI